MGEINIKKRSLCFMLCMGPSCKRTKTIWYTRRKRNFLKWGFGYDLACDEMGIPFSFIKW